MHMDVRGRPRDPFISWGEVDRGIQVVSQPCSVDDLFGRAPSAIDALISADGTGGRIPELIAAGHPVVMLTDWQSLFNDGNAAGLRELDEVLGRIRRHFGDELAWTTCSDLAKMALAEELP